MEKILKETVITFQQNNQELQYVQIYKYHKFGCKAIYQSTIQQKLYDVYIVSKYLLSLTKNQYDIQTMIRKYQQISYKLICPIIAHSQSSQYHYIISNLQNYTLGDLVTKRQGLTQFQIMYFMLDFQEGLNYMKSRNLMYQKLDLNEIRLSSNNKIVLPFTVQIMQISKFITKIDYEQKKPHICPQLINEQQISCDKINAWNIGVFIYQLFYNQKPFSQKSNILEFDKTITNQLKKMIKSLLDRNSETRLKISLIFVEDIFKKYQNLPHLLPNTIFYCPPTAQFVTEYDRQLIFDNLSNMPHSPSSKVFNVKTAKQLVTQKIAPLSHKNLAIKSFKSFKHLRFSQSSLQQQRTYITQFIDLSHKFGYGYQLNTGLIGFKFNDSSEMFFQSYDKKNVIYKQKKNTISFAYDKIPQEIQIKKKLYIMQAFSKSLKTQKYYPTITNHSLPSQANLDINSQVKIAQYMKTNYAAVFLLSTMNIIQVIFIDKFMVLLNKNMIYIQLKNSDRFQNIESLSQTSDLIARKKYALKMAQKMFHWNISSLEKVGPSNQKDKKNSYVKKLCSMNQLLISDTQKSNQQSDMTLHKN